jgi:hypothetical protein
MDWGYFVCGNKKDLIVIFFDGDLGGGTGQWLKFCCAPSSVFSGGPIIVV